MTCCTSFVKKNAVRTMIAASSRPDIAGVDASRWRRHAGAVGRWSPTSRGRLLVQLGPPEAIHGRLLWFVLAGLAARSTLGAINGPCLSVCDFSGDPTAEGPAALNSGAFRSPWCNVAAGAGGRPLGGTGAAGLDWAPCFAECCGLPQMDASGSRGSAAALLVSFECLAANATHLVISCDPAGSPAVAKVFGAASAAPLAAAATSEDRPQPRRSRSVPAIDGRAYVTAFKSAEDAAATRRSIQVSRLGTRQATSSAATPQNMTGRRSLLQSIGGFVEDLLLNAGNWCAAPWVVLPQHTRCRCSQTSTPVRALPGAALTMEAMRAFAAAAMGGLKPAHRMRSMTAKTFRSPPVLRPARS